ncbi:hypothetical protein KR018_002930, partial [Drosophila ironensis]
IEVRMTKVECPNYLPDVAKNISCHINRTASGNPSVFAEFSLMSDVNDAKGFYLFTLHRGSFINNRTAVNLDYCQALENLQSDIFIKLMAAEIRRIANFPQNCPFRKNTRYYLNGFTVNSDFIPSYAPELNFISDCHIYINKRKAIQLTVYGSLVRR